MTLNKAFLTPRQKTSRMNALKAISPPAVLRVRDDAEIKAPGCAEF